ncbi:MAG TPA: efflux RND transporter periplasmic adaptor subunit [Capsulimonadaceae bacterium]
MPLKMNKLITASLALSLLAAGCGGKHDDATGGGKAGQQPVVVAVSTAQMVDVPRMLSATGDVSAELNADIATRTPGRVVTVAAKEGDRVRRGQALITLDARDLDAGIAQAQAGVNSATVAFGSAAENERMTEATTAAQITAAQAQVGQAQAALATANARRDLVNAGPRPQERAAAAQNVARANASLVLARKTYDRMAYLYKSDAISAQQLDGARSEYDAAQAAYQSATQNQSMVDEGSRAEDKAAADAAVRQAQAALDQARAGLVQANAAAMQVNVRRADVQAAKAQIGSAKAALGAAVANRSYSVITAPFDGIVSQRLADPGSMAGPGVPLLHLQGGDLRLDAVVPESAVKLVHKGGQLPVLLDALGPTPLVATIVSISPQGDPASHTFLVKARLSQGSGARAGMYGRAQIKMYSERKLTVPAASIIARDGLAYVYVIDSGVARLRLVTAGDSVGERTVVLSGLREGDKVASSGVDKLADNQPVAEGK